ncbi:MAG: peroxiredoxin-like family protein [Xanthomonadales bacterium]|nr:peroxiredoxin-like family protein [Xanthomonadales bacterium]
MSTPLPGRPAHDLELPLVSGERWSLAEQRPERFTLLVFYRGLHCPVCASNLSDLQRRLDRLDHLGVQVMTASCDTLARARESVDEWGIDQLNVGYDLRIDEARSWGLYISSSISEAEPDRFCEPGLFLIRPDRIVYAASVQSMPFARPHYDDLIDAIEYVLEHDYPPRGAVE